MAEIERSAKRERFSGRIIATFFLLFAAVGGVGCYIAMVNHNPIGGYMFGGALIAIWILAVIIWMTVPSSRSSSRSMSEYNSPEIVCPHCHKRGMVNTKPVLAKKGIDGTKAAAALLTGGLSLPLAGLSRREKLTEAHCGNCGSTWTF
jgi:DNA-directed RNA polymerase subunit RPC12/RpoP